MDDFGHFRLRLPIDLKNKIEKESQKNSRSLNSEILHALTTHYNTENEPDIVERIAALEKAVFYTKEHPVAKYRKMHGWTKVELAEKLGVHFSKISKIERNEERPGKDFIISFCKLFNVSVEHFINELEEYNK